MGSGVNKVLLLGNLGLDPEPFTTRDGRPAARMRVATSRTWTDRAGQRRDETEWHTVKAYGPLADNCLRYLHKGRRVLVEGRLHHNSWENEQKEQRRSTEIVAARVDFLDRPEQGGDHRSHSASAPPTVLEVASPPV